MSLTKHEDDCPGCRPAVIDTTTGKQLEDDHPVMVAINKVWALTKLSQREAFHRVTCQNSRDPGDIAVIHEIQRLFMTEAMKHNALPEEPE